MGRTRWTRAELWKLSRACQIYENQRRIIKLIEFPDVGLVALNNAVDRLTNFEPDDGLEKLDLRADTDPQSVAEEIQAHIDSHPTSRTYLPSFFVAHLKREKVVEEVYTASEETIEESQVEYLRSRIKQLESSNTQLFKAIGSQRELGTMVAEAVRAVPPYKKYTQAKVSKSKTPVSAIFLWSDWHIGEVIDSEETEGFGEYNYQIAEHRLFKIIDDFLRWVEVQREAYHIDHCAVYCLGDYISGDIHHELVATNEFPVPVQTAKAGILMGEGFRRLSPHFENIDAYQNSGNHDRLTKKMQFKQRGSNSFAYLVHTIADTYAEKLDNLTIHQTLGTKQIASVADWNFLLEHGDGMRAWMGIPFYGIEREKGREAFKRMNTDKTFDCMAIGHWHVPTLLGGVILINGSLSGTTEYDHGAGRHSPPCQVGCLVHPEHGIFNLVPFIQRVAA